MKTKRQVEGEGIGPVLNDSSQDVMVEVRVLPKGDGQISTGKHDPEGGDVVYERGDIFEIEESIAKALEDRGFAEIQQAKRGPGRPPKTETE